MRTYSRWGDQPTAKPHIQQRKPRHRKLVLLCVGVVMIFGGGSWFYQRGTIQGIPTPIVLKFITDQPARAAYFSGQKGRLHARLQELEVEKEIKAFYRPQFSDEVELDRFIHQLMYERTGYVGKSYRVGPNDRLVLKSQIDHQFPRWFSLAFRAGLVVSSQEEDGVWYVTTSEGDFIPYKAMASIFPIRTLKKLVNVSSGQ